MEKKNLPSIQELYNMTSEAKELQTNFNILVNQPPAESWIREHPLAKNVKYIPIGFIEYLLTKLFLRWRVEIKTVQLIANACVVTLRLHFQNILNDEWDWQDGLGAAPIQTKKGAGAMEWNETLSDAVMKAAPAAESYAIKDAAEKIGKIFGKDLNRKDEMGYDLLAKDKKETEEKHADIFDEETNK